ncbi:hypothetical protein V501_02229 [Pseudogymnoascus sp. VKM F-4519 (FW-2642)]|nr:hypothetical protein V501_02229 [Pseudogymnoascus sp. VKM F-4519 (FW-2642)]
MLVITFAVVVDHVLVDEVISVVGVGANTADTVTGESVVIDTVDLLIVLGTSVAVELVRSPLDVVKYVDFIVSVAVVETPVDVDVNVEVAPASTQLSTPELIIGIESALARPPEIHTWLHEGA